MLKDNMNMLIVVKPQLVQEMLLDCIDVFSASPGLCAL